MTNCMRCKKYTDDTSCKHYHLCEIEIEDLKKKEQERVMRILKFMDPKVAGDVQWVLERSDEILNIAGNTQT